jgi:putative transposase
MRYRRAKTPGATYFFTVVTYRRRPILCDPERVRLLRDAFRTVKRRHPFSIDAFVLLPDHLHCLWTLPPEDCDYPTRWMLIKSLFTRHCAPSLKTTRSAALDRKRLQPVWQQRYWEHQIRDDRDFERHCDYIHYNPVKHGHVARVADWPYSSFHRFVRDGAYPADWAGGGDLSDEPGFGE